MGEGVVSSSMKNESGCRRGVDGWMDMDWCRVRVALSLAGGGCRRCKLLDTLQAVHH